MTPELQTYYENYLGLFPTVAWKQLKEDFSNNALAINSVEATKDENDMYFRKGQLSVIAHILNMEALIEQSYEEAKNNEDS